MLTHAGKVSAEAMQRIADERFDQFDAQRRRADALAADAEDLKAIEDLEDDLRRRRDEPPKDAPPS